MKITTNRMLLAVTGRSLRTPHPHPSTLITSTHLVYSPGTPCRGCPRHFRLGRCRWSLLPLNTRSVRPRRLYEVWSEKNAGCSSEVRWVIRSILHGVDPLSYFSFQPVLHDWCNKGRGMCYPVCGMMHIKEPLVLIGKSSLCGGSGFPLSLSE